MGGRAAQLAKLVAIIVLGSLSIGMTAPKNHRGEPVAQALPNL